MTHDLALRARPLYRNKSVAPPASHLAQLQRAPRYAFHPRGLGALGCQSCAQPLGALGASFFTKLIKSAIPGPNDFKLKSTPKEIKKVIAVAGPALSAIPGWGTVAAAGAAVVTAADQKLKAQRLAGTAGGAAMLDEYKQFAGQVPGRVFGVDNVRKIIDAIGIGGGWPNVKKWQGSAIDGALYGCKGCTPPTLVDWVNQKLSAGQDNPVALVNDWTNHVNATWGSKWLVGSAGELQRQAIVDLLDALIAKANPSAPLYYAQPATEPPPQVLPTPGPAPAPGNTPPSNTAPAPKPQPLPAPAPTPAPVPVPSPQSITDPNLQAYIKALLDQGQTQQQAFTTALAALGQSGQQITPQVQAAVADTVQNTASSNQLPLMIGLALGGGALLYFAARRRGKRA